MSEQRAACITHWLEPERTAATVSVWRTGYGGDRYCALRDRATISVDLGAATVHLRPTAAELRALIAALEWALEPEAVAT
jgi:ribonuclease HI